MKGKASKKAINLVHKTKTLTKPGGRESREAIRGAFEKPYVPPLKLPSEETRATVNGKKSHTPSKNEQEPQFHDSSMMLDSHRSIHNMFDETPNVFQRPIIPRLNLK